MLAFTFGVFGLIIGSFLNVLVLRWGEKGLGGRSACVSCARQLRWYEMVPVLSWIVLRGKCRTCKARISIQYPLVEAITGIVFALIGSASLPVSTLYLLLFCLIAAVLIAVAVYDLYHTIIPDIWVYLFAVLAFISQALLTPGGGFGVLLFLAGPIAALPLFLLWAVSRGAWMGFGDVKLALGIGWLLGPFYGIAAIFFGFVIGAVVSVGVLLPLPHIAKALSRIGITVLAPRPGGFTMKSEIPFGPFLVASTFIIWLLLIHNIDPLALVGLSLS